MQMSSFNTLPHLLQLEITHYLEVDSLVALCQVGLLVVNSAHRI